MLPVWYNNYKTLIETSINNYLENYFEDEKNCGLNEIKEAVFYSVKGGKKIRSILALEFYLIFSGKEFEKINNNSDILKLCIAIELFHLYSLIHDDLPAIDNDELRRGQETVWKKFGEDNAIFTGDFLNSLSFEILSETGNIELIKLFGQTAGIKGMIGGQILDIFYEKNSEKLNIENLEEVHNKKTGALIEFSILGGIILGKKFFNTLSCHSREGGNPYQMEKIFLEKFKKFGKNIGLAFQIKDDLLDIEGTKEETGKSVGGENKGFVYFLGIEKTKKLLEEKISESKKIISDLNSEKLDFIVEYIGNRKK